MTSATILLAGCLLQIGTWGVLGAFEVRPLLSGGPRVELFALQPNAAETGAAGEIEVKRSTGLSQQITVKLRIRGNAVNGLDYHQIESDVTLAQGIRRAVIRVIPISDQIVEIPETVDIEILPTSAYTIAEESRSARVTIFDRGDQMPRITFLAPTSGASPSSPPGVAIAASVSGAFHTFHRADFFINGEFVGRSEIPDFSRLRRGEPVVHSFYWRNTPGKAIWPGNYTVTARAYGNGIEAVSAPFSFQVVDRSSPPVLLSPAVTGTVIGRPDMGNPTIAISGAIESSFSATLTAGRELRRGYIEFGIPNFAVPVRKAELVLVETPRLEQTPLVAHELASYDADLQITPGDFDQPIKEVLGSFEAGRGQQSVIDITSAVAGAQGQNLGLRIQRLQIPDLIGWPSVGTEFMQAYLRVETSGPQQFGLAITSPADGAVFAIGTEIVVKVRAVDPAGVIRRVELFEGGTQVGVSNIDPSQGPGSPVEHEFRWTGATVGRHQLSARAVDSLHNPIMSGVIGLEIVKALPNITAIRVLPTGYYPGVPLTVNIYVVPDSTVRAYTVEETLPEEWVPSDFSDEGKLDELTGRVKFGPFFDNESRLLTYKVAPSTNTVGVQVFSGVVSADGSEHPVVPGRAETVTPGTGGVGTGEGEIDVGTIVVGGTGSAAIPPAPLNHPADISPTDGIMTAAELTAYAAAWKAGDEWPFGPVPIPIEFVTRAGFLWQNGEEYYFESSNGDAPLWWVNPPPPTNQTATAMSWRPYVGHELKNLLSLPGEGNVIPVNISMSASGEIALRVHTKAGTKYVIEVSDDLVDWSVWSEFTSGSGNPELLLDADVDARSRRFYRVREKM